MRHKQTFPPLQARSSDGGRNWIIEAFNGIIPGAESLSADENLMPALKAGNNLDGSSPTPLRSPVDPETIVIAARSWFYVSRDVESTGTGRTPSPVCRSTVWLRIDIVALSSRKALFRLTPAKSDGSEGETCCAGTGDGARTFRVIGVPVEDPDDYAIMPASVRLPDGTIISILRRGCGVDDPSWLGAYFSMDCGCIWRGLETWLKIPARG